jgi:hypothetical protein
VLPCESVLEKAEDNTGEGEWSVGAKGTSQDRSGGGPTFTYTYLRNPQVYKHFLLNCFLKILFLLRKCTIHL